MQSSRVQTVGRRQTNYRECRPNDYLYDPIYCVSGIKDHNASCMAAAQQTAECTICPVYNSMFTDLHTLPRHVISVKFGNLATYVDMSWPAKQKTMATQFQGSKEVDIGGVDRHRFFRRPLVPFMHPILPPLHYSADKTALVDWSPRSKASKTRSPFNSTAVLAPLIKTTSAVAPLPPPPVTVTTATQTDYRESEAQTDPWDTPYVIHGDTTPEIISLAHLSWKKGLPAGMHEIEIIERARIKRAWESTLPPVTDVRSADKRRKIVEAIERDEWAFREAEIQHINELRLELTKRLLDEKLGQLADRHEERIAKYRARRYEDKEKKVAVIRHDTSRALRKLHLKHTGVTAKYHKGDVVEEHADRKSEWYGPQMRFGENPRRAHLNIRCDPRFFTHVKGLEMVEKVPKMLPGYDVIRFAAPTTRESYELCIRETRWTEEKLRKLHEDLKEIRMKRQQGPAPLRLLKRVPKAVERCTTPTIEGVPDWEEEVFEAAVLLQKIIRGRAIQSMMYRGMNKCSELIEELRSTHALHEAGMEQRAEERFEVMSQQRAHQLINMKKGALEETLGSLESEAISETLDFFSKELWRLQDERRVHAFALLAERERHRREALEAGRRQVEERRRKEHDEMFKQVVKLHQDTVDIYLEDLILDSMKWVAEDEARQYVRDLARRVDKAAHEAHIRKDCIEQEEIIADLIHNFVMPEVQKQLVREKMRLRQEKYLTAAHDSIYGTARQQAARPAGYGNKRQSSVVPSTAAALGTNYIAQRAAANDQYSVPQFSGQDLPRRSEGGESALLFSSFRTKTNEELEATIHATAEDDSSSDITVDHAGDNPVIPVQVFEESPRLSVSNVTFLEILNRDDRPTVVKTETESDDKGETETVFDDKGKTETVSDDKGETETVSDDKGETETVSDDKTPKGETETVSDDKGKTETVSDDKGETETVSDHKGEPETVSDDKGETETVSDDKAHKGETDNVSDDKGETETVSDDKAHKSEIETVSDDKAHTSATETVSDDKGEKVGGTANMSAEQETFQTRVEFGNQDATIDSVVETELVTEDEVMIIGEIVGKKDVNVKLEVDLSIVKKEPLDMEEEDIRFERVNIEAGVNTSWIKAEPLDIKEEIFEDEENFDTTLVKEEPMEVKEKRNDANETVGVNAVESQLTRESIYSQDMD